MNTELDQECDALDFAMAVRDAVAERDRLRAQRDELLPALRPFSFAVKGEIDPDATVWIVGSGWNVYGRDLIAARDAIAKVEAQQ